MYHNVAAKVRANLRLVSRVIGLGLAAKLGLAVLALAVTPWLRRAGFYASSHFSFTYSQSHCFQLFLFRYGDQH